MTRTLILGGLAALGLAFSPLAPAAHADWYSEQLDKLQAGANKVRDDYPAYYDKWRAGQQKAWESYLDSLDKVGGIPRRGTPYTMYPSYGYSQSSYVPRSYNGGSSLATPSTTPPAVPPTPAPPARALPAGTRIFGPFSVR